ncbi:MAG: aminoacetone oxidase family FAD-binding enzyme [Deltaproteobacteria bacterium CG11_big_fil_rev_8_21_14_0_20_47_16]|nr:MAG: aminoacetone oxidase family FAD-binding enzyme [Deltaproteobacteria bacterium CG11_big_fil_rev_8_21_14_0_20_47_16]
MPTNTSIDAVIIGAGGAGMMCAQTAARRGRSVVLIDHAHSFGAKILISGGGRCNFTNTGAGPKNYVSHNPHFCKSALSRFTPEDFIAMVQRHKIPYHEKKLGQLFCDGSAQAIIDMLVAECRDAGVHFALGTCVNSIQKDGDVFQVATSRGNWTCQSLVIATGGLSIPKIGATGFGYEIAQQFGHRIIPTAAALDGFVLPAALLKRTSALSGISIDCIVTCHDTSFRENILFTHKGISGPAALQASLYWKPNTTIVINTLPDTSAKEWLLKKKANGSGAEIHTVLKEKFPDRFAVFFADTYASQLPRVAQCADKDLIQLAEKLQHWEIVPSGTVGYSKAEVTRGGVDTNELSSKTMESRLVHGLYFIGEVMDVTGWLGGYNFQWAWASGFAAGESV